MSLLLVIWNLNFEKQSCLLWFEAALVRCVGGWICAMMENSSFLSVNLISSLCCQLLLLLSSVAIKTISYNPKNVCAVVLSFEKCSWFKKTFILFTNDHTSTSPVCSKPYWLIKYHLRGPVSPHLPSRCVSVILLYCLRIELCLLCFPNVICS